MHPLGALQKIGRIQPGSMLDIGARDGRIAVRFAELGYQVHAVDPDPVPGAADKWPSGVTFEKTSLEDLVAAQPRDLVVASMVSHLVRYDTRAFLGRLKSLTRPEGGLVYVTLTGDEDGWASHPWARAISMDEALKIIQDIKLTPLFRATEWHQGYLYSGEEKFWHLHTFVLENQDIMQ